MTAPELPPNVQDFNAITGVLFAQLYTSVPVPTKIDPDAVASALGLQDRQARMSSGKPFSELLSHTIMWLNTEGFIRSQPGLPLERAVLTDKGLAVMSFVPPSLSRPLGSELADATEETSTEGGKRKIAELMGNFFGSAIGSFTKSISSS
jgi:hypothetical protein